MKDLEGVLAIVLCCGGPVFLIVGWIMASINRTNKENALRQSIVEHKTDSESVKLLLAAPRKRIQSFAMLRAGCLFLSVSIAAILGEVVGNVDMKMLIFLMALGGGIGMLVAFVVELWLNKKLRAEESEKQESV